MLLCTDSGDGEGRKQKLQLSKFLLRNQTTIHAKAPARPTPWPCRLAPLRTISKASTRLMHQALALFTRIDSYLHTKARAALIAKLSQEGISVERETGLFVVKRKGKTCYTNTKWIVRWKTFEATSLKSGGSCVRVRACACVCVCVRVLTRKCRIFD